MSEQFDLSLGRVGLLGIFGVSDGSAELRDTAAASTDELGRSGAEAARSEPVPRSGVVDPGLSLPVQLAPLGTSVARSLKDLQDADALLTRLNARSRREQAAQRRGPSDGETDRVEPKPRFDADDGAKRSRQVRPRSAERRRAEPDGPASDVILTPTVDQPRSHPLRYRDWDGSSDLGSRLDIDPSASGQGRDGRQDGRDLPPDEEVEQQRLSADHAGRSRTGVQARIARDLDGRPSVTVRAGDDGGFPARSSRS